MPVCVMVMILAGVNHSRWRSSAWAVLVPAGSAVSVEAMVGRFS